MGNTGESLDFRSFEQDEKAGPNKEKQGSRQQEASENRINKEGTKSLSGIKQDRLVPQHIFVPICNRTPTIADILEEIAAYGSRNT